uniref:Alpha-type protein kinase domain-containing protein n=1 Tax=Aureoumbra lagunensis TaxID=44058 RepID=A0A7S3JW90_9STRA
MLATRTKEKEEETGSESSFSSSSRSKALFKKAILKQKQDGGDPWAKHEIHKLKAERVKRHRYDASQDKWRVDESVVKMQEKSFARGAMRECFRLKKISQQPRQGMHALSWKTSNNYVAKKYLGQTSGGKEEAMNDCRLQMTAGLIAEAFSRLNPPKRVVIIHCCVLEFFQREPPSFFLCERYIDGTDSFGNDFVKHNSNGGFIDDQEKRLTPQLFSAASFYLNHGRVLVCDVQGVADLYTDPCIHSARQTFGESDLGRRGMALFFQSYPTPPLFTIMGLPNFTLSIAETRRCSMVTDEKRAQSRQEKKSRVSAIESARTLSRRNRRRSSQTILPLANISTSVKQTLLTHDNNTKEEEEMLIRSALDAAAAEAVSILAQRIKFNTLLDTKNHMIKPPDLSRRSTSQETEVDDELNLIRAYSSPRTPQLPNIERDKELRLNLAEVHAALAELESEGRFTDNEPDENSAVLHLAIAAHLGSPIAAHALARFHSGLSPGALAPPGVLPHLRQPQLAGSFFALAAIRGDAAAAAVIGLHTELLSPHFSTFALACLHQALDATSNHTRTTPQQNISLNNFALGSIVEADYAAEGFYYKCQILTMHDDFTYDLHYIEDDEIETCVPANRIRKLQEHLTDNQDVTANNDNNNEKKNMITPGGSGGELPPRYILLAALAEHTLLTNNDTAAAADLFKQAAETALRFAPTVSSKYFERAAALDLNSSS